MNENLTGRFRLLKLTSHSSRSDCTAVLQSGASSLTKDLWQRTDSGCREHFNLPTAKFNYGLPSSYSWINTWISNSWYDLVLAMFVILKWWSAPVKNEKLLPEGFVHSYSLTMGKGQFSESVYFANQCLNLDTHTHFYLHIRVSKWRKNWQLICLMLADTDPLKYADPKWPENT